MPGSSSRSSSSTDASQTFPRPDWLGAEVTHLARFYNVNLVRHPYSAWDEHERERLSIRVSLREQRLELLESGGHGA